MASWDWRNFVRVGLLIGLVGLALLLYAADRLVKVRKRARRRRMMTRRLAAATDRADQQLEQRQVASQASDALTSFMPAIQRPPSDLPGMPPHGPARSRTARKRPAARDHEGGLAARRLPRSGEHPARPADRPHGEPAAHAPRPLGDSRPAS